MKTFVRNSFFFAAATLALIVGFSANVLAQCGVMFSSNDATLIFESKNGKSVTRTFYVKNLLAGTVSGAFVISGTDAANFKVEPAEFSLIELGQKKEVSITYTPTPNTLRAGAAISLQVNGAVCYSAELIGTVSNSGGNDSNVITVKMDPAEYQFPATDVGSENCKDFYFVNKSLKSVFVSGWKIDGDFDDHFYCDITTADIKEVKPGESLKIKVCYKPLEKLAQATGYLEVQYAGSADAKDWASIKAWFAAKSTGGNDTTNVKNCISAGEPDDSWRVQVALGESADRKLTLYNKSSVAITINSARLDCEDQRAFAITTTFPITIQANSSADIDFTFTPFDASNNNGKTKEKYLACVIFGMESNPAGNVCEQFKGTLWGLGVYMRDGDKDQDSNKSVAKPIGEKTTIGLTNKGVKESYTLLFYNNFDYDLNVTDIKMDNGTFFKVAETNPSTLPFTLAPGGEFTVTIEFESTDKLVHKDKLIIIAEHAATAFEFDLVGINPTEFSNVRKGLPEGVAISVSPNPMRTNLTVALDGVREANIEVLDVLGKSVNRANVTGTWQWNAGSLAAGTYFVRIDGVSANGEHFVTTRSVAVEK